MELLEENQGLSFYTLNCQSLQAHSYDFCDKVTQRCDILILTETRLDMTDHIDIENFVCINQFRKEVHGHIGGVAIYKNNKSAICNFESLPHLSQVQEELKTNGIFKVGDLCGVLCILENDFRFIMISIYLYPNQSIRDIINYIEHSLQEYKVTCNKIPLIISGDFNVNFQQSISAKLIEYLSVSYDLVINSNPNSATTIHNTTIDAVFSRYIPQLQSKVYVTYFSYHLPIISFFPLYFNKNKDCIDYQNYDDIVPCVNLMNDKSFVDSRSSRLNNISFSNSLSDYFQINSNDIVRSTPIGLPNLDGISCYANASIVALFNCPIIQQFFKNEESSNILSEFYEQYSLGNLIDIKMIRSIVNPVIYGQTQQQDSSEFMNHLFNILPDLEKILQFDIIITRKCTICFEETTKSEKYNLFTVSLKNVVVDGLYNLQQILDDMFTNVVVPKALCSYCGMIGDLEELIFLEPKEDIIILHFNRFVSLTEKLIVKLRVMRDNSVVNINNNQYKISCVVHHFGDTPNSGHYTTTVCFDKDKWFYVDDSQVYEISPGLLDSPLLVILIKQ